MPATLTPKGQAKVAAFLSAVKQTLEAGLTREVGAMRATAASLAPSPEQEGILISQGQPGEMDGAGGRSTPGGGLVGTPEDGRFLRLAEQTSLREAISTDPVRVTSTGDTIMVGTGGTARINFLTGFYWMTRRRGLQGPSEPFNRAYVQAVETGGAVWVVVPRPPNKRLTPEPGITTKMMVKTMPPFQMYRRTPRLHRGGLQRVLLATRVAARKVGRA